MRTVNPDTVDYLIAAGVAALLFLFAWVIR
jgi:hypothetical protein